ncbi:MAG: ABC transporter ATP-binding protein [Vicinamibacterales bacterium]|nr:ABC transporter ATP-binding protein [Vicinamibacterales bacterium]
MLTADSLSFAYGTEPVLEGVSLRVPRGALLGLLGPNGSGKTTLLRLLSGTLAPVAGTVRLDGRDVRHVPRVEMARRVAMVPQETQLAFEYSVLEIALMGRYPHLGPFELEGPEDVAIARAALEATGTLALARRPFATLSGGEKQRVVIASALAQFEPRQRTTAAGRPAPGPGLPQLLLLDEPTASLDLHYQLEVVSLLRRLNRERRLTMIVSTHDLNVAASLCEHVVMLREGRVIASGPTAGVLTAEGVRALYGVDVHVERHEVSGHLTVVPLW